MIVFDLACPLGHRFEGWFASSDAFAEQRARGLVACPYCDDTAVTKAPMAPAVAAKSNRAAEPRPPVQMARNVAPMPPEVTQAFRALATMQARALANSEWVGDRFAQEVRSMHYGESDEKLVHGRASREDAEALLEEGIAVAPLLVPLCPPEERN